MSGPRTSRSAPTPPVNDVVWEILLALSGGDKHGYAILLDVERRGDLFLLPGSLYRALHRLEREGWVEAVAASAETGDGRRRVLRLTSAGRRAAKSEARRLAAAVAEARRRGLLTGREGSS